MTGREVMRIAFELGEPPRVPVTLIGGGAWNVHLEGETFAGIKENPNTAARIKQSFFMVYVFNEASPPACSTHSQRH